MIKDQLSINFIKFKSYAFAFSFIIMVIGFISLFYNGGFNYSIDFSGGIQSKINLNENSSVKKLKSILGKKIHIVPLDNSKKFLFKFVVDKNKVSNKEFKDDFLQHCLDFLLSKSIKVKKEDFLVNYINSVGFQISVLNSIQNKSEIEALLETFLKTKKNKDNIFQVGLSSALNSIWIMNPLKSVYKNIEILEENIYEPTQGQLIKSQSFLIIFLFFILLLSYIAFRFEFKFGIISIITLIHDVIIILCFMAILKKDIDTSSIIGILTIIGYSLNDTIVIFDRIRENYIEEDTLSIDHYKNQINKSISQSLIRSLITSMTTLFVILSVLFLGGDSLSNLSFILFIGVLIGTYSSIFIASPMLVLWEKIKLYRAS